MINVYIGTLLELPFIEVLYPNLGNKEKENIFAEKLFGNFTDPVVAITNDADKADYLLIPHNYSQYKNNKSYIEEFVSLSKKYNKKIIIFLIGDSDEKVNIPNAIVFRHSQYKYKKQPNEIIMPAYAVDLSTFFSFSCRTKNEHPTIGFCGWAYRGSPRLLLKDAAKNAWIYLESLFSTKLVRARIKGITFRIKAINVLNRSASIITHFIIRKSYGGNSKTISVPVRESRAEYISNMESSDLILCVKGDGNFSIRFFETLSAGRIPLLIDTQCVLPLEKDVDYSQFTVKVPYDRIPAIESVVTEFWKNTTDEDWKKMQQNAKAHFDNYLRIDTFFKFIFSGNNLKRYADLP